MFHVVSELLLARQRPSVGIVSSIQLEVRAHHLRQFKGGITRPSTTLRNQSKPPVNVGAKRHVRSGVRRDGGTAEIRLGVFRVFHVFGGLATFGRKRPVGFRQNLQGVPGVYEELQHAAAAAPLPNMWRRVLQHMRKAEEHGKLE